MERTSNNFNLFDFDVEAFARAYYQSSPTGQRSENAPDASFEERLGELQLDSSDESSTKAGSPDTGPAESHRRMRSTDEGDLMRMPLRDDRFSGARHSVGLPRGRIGDLAAGLSRSDLRGTLFSSTRYTSSSETQPEIQTKNTKNRGLWSRIKSGVGKAFAKSRSEKASGAFVQREIVSTSVRVDHAKQPARIRGVFDADEALLEELRSRATGQMSDGTIRNAQADVRNFSAWLSRNRRAPIAGRLGNPELEPGLERDLQDYANDRNINTRRTSAALNKLREVQAGRVLSTSNYRLAPYSADESLIDLWAAAEKATGRVEPDTVDRQARRLARLSDWLERHQRGAMAGRLFTHGLAQDVEEYKQQTGDSKIKPDLLRLQRYQQVVDANQALELPPPGQAYLPAEPPQELPPMPDTPSEGAWSLFREQMHGPTSSSPAQDVGLQGSSQELPATLAITSDEGWTWSREYAQGPATPSAAGSSSSDFYSGLEPLVNLDSPTPYGFRGDVRSPPALAGPSAAPQEVPDIGHIVGEGWRHGSQSASVVLIDVLDNVNLLPNQFGPRRVDINGEPYSVTLGPGGRSDVRLIHHPRARQRDEAGSSRQLHSPGQINEAGPSRPGVPDLGYLIRGGWQHRERLLPNYLARAIEGNQLMPEPGRPTYFNIRGVPYKGELVETDGGPRVRIYPEVG
ncbi:hypothetical protein GGE07_005690 [Sinorhizobium terangae]|uniref:Uncharacterized protein n=1 Tax=Sinorhizobium terangae TaxID=110322 RepID=A0A6N7LHQ6_SINTE|nr:hypothetical protein [Sinorhizobium terangae]MBB4189011.1 hypothetical protein [Sinorhizobium terangae]MQX16284.1 hypothetical protein [Sinorhizobium terangae]